jgi:hypothetical protein
MIALKKDFTSWNSFEIMVVLSEKIKFFELHFSKSE